MINKEMLSTNIISDSDTKEIIELTLETISTALAKSLGPYGATTIVQKSNTDHIMTKDGFNILKNMRFNDPKFQTILSILQDISAEMVMRVGDGSTSCIVASNELYKRIYEMNEKEKLRPKELIDRLNKLTELILNEIQKIKKPVSKDLHEIKNLAAVSLNNDAKLGELIYGIYSDIGKEGFINIKLGNQTQTTYKKSEGFQIDFGYLDKVLVNTDTDECKLYNSYILMFDAPLNDDTCLPFIEKCINTVIAEQGASIVIIAPSFGKTITAYLRNIITYNQNNRGISNKIDLIAFPLGTEMAQNMFYDLACKVGATPIMNSLDEPDKINELGLQVLGIAKQVVSTYNTTSFLGQTNQSEKIKERIGTIETELKLLNDEGIMDNVKTYELKKRLAVLNGNLATIYVGGNSEHAKKADKHLIEDAVSACKSAIYNGYVSGCNISIPHAIIKIYESENLKENKSLDDIDMELLKHILCSFKAVFQIICKNKSGEHCDMDGLNKIFNECSYEYKVYDLVKEQFDCEDKIINSVETEYEILRNVISIMTLLVTSNQFVTINPTSPIC